MGHIYMIDMTTEWRRLIGSPKLQIIFHKRATKYRSLLPKMTIRHPMSLRHPVLLYVIMSLLLLYIIVSFIDYNK